MIQAVPGMKERHLLFHWMTVRRTSIEEASKTCRRMIEERSKNIRSAFEEHSKNGLSLLLNLKKNFYGKDR